MDNNKPQNGPNGNMQRVEAKGIVKIFDKDGKLKGQLKIVSLELPQAGVRK